MQLVCKQSELNQALSLVSRAVPAKPSHPILENILMDVSDNKISFTGFDLSLGVKSTTDAVVTVPGCIAVPAKVLTDIVSRLPEGDVSLSLEQVGEGSILRIKHKRNKYDIRVVDPSEYPELPQASSNPITLQSSLLLSGLRGTIFAASPDESKGVLTGVNLRIDKTAIRFATTDGHRLSAVEIANEFDTSSASITIPAKSLSELEKMLAKTSASDDEIKLFIDDFQIIFEWGNQRLTTRALEAQFPDYPQLLPKQFEKTVTCDRKELISAIDRLSVLNVSNNTIQVDFDIESQQMKLHCISQSVGEGEEIIDCSVTGYDISVAFNADYLIEGLKSISSTEIQLNINKPLMPVVLNPVGGLKQRYLVMPVELK